MEVKDLEKVTLRLFKGDVDRVRAAAPKLGASFVIRNLVASWLEKVEGNAPPPALDAEIRDIVDKAMESVND